MQKKKTGMAALAMGIILITGCQSTNYQMKEGTLQKNSNFPSTSADSRVLAHQSLEDLSKRYTDYKVGPEDLIRVSIFEWELSEETKTSAFRVSESGIVALPVIGEIDIGGQTVDQVKKTIEKRLKEGGFLRNPRVAVDIQEYRSKRVAVVGAVNDPGVYTLRQNVSTLLEVLSLAGGVQTNAGQFVHVVQGAARNETELLQENLPDDQFDFSSKKAAQEEDEENSTNSVAQIHLYELLSKGNPKLNMVVQNEDMVYVPEAEPFSVTGYVKNPGTFSLRRPTTVLEAIARAGGVQRAEASPEACYIYRQTENEQQKMIPVNLEAIAAGKDANQYMQPGDTLVVGQTQFKRIRTQTYQFFRDFFSFGYSLN